MQTSRVNLLGLTRDELESWFALAGEKSCRASQVMKWLYHEDADDFGCMANISRNVRELLKREAEISMPEILDTCHSRDGTVKWLLRLHDGEAIETVYIPERDRGTLCVSSQVGCVLDCAFCATGREGFSRNLRAWEIVAQFRLVRRELGYVRGGHRIITNVVLMGMGEPLLNYRNVVAAARIMMDDFGPGLSRHRITLSTSGLVPQIDRLSVDCPVALAVSLHAPNDELRNRLVPINRKYNIAKLLATCWRYSARDGDREVTFEYALMRDVNDSLEHADALAGLLVNRPAKINLIPFNPYPGADFLRPSKAVMQDFQYALRSRGLVTTMRKTRGEDISAACGQLKGRVTDRTRIRLGDRSFGLAVRS